MSIYKNQVHSKSQDTQDVLSHKTKRQLIRLIGKAKAIPYMRNKKSEGKVIVDSGLTRYEWTDKKIVKSQKDEQQKLVQLGSQEGSVASSSTDVVP